MRQDCHTMSTLSLLPLYFFFLKVPLLFPSYPKTSPPIWMESNLSWGQIQGTLVLTYDFSLLT